MVTEIRVALRSASWRPGPSRPEIQSLGWLHALRRATKSRQKRPWPATRGHGARPAVPDAEVGK